MDRVALNLKAGRIPVDFGDVPRMCQPTPKFGATLDPARVATVLGLEEEDLDGRYPVQEVSTGLPCVVVPLRSLDVLERCLVDRRTSP